ncbi:MAG: hypothetical protein V1784_11185 [bacterium]
MTKKDVEELAKALARSRPGGDATWEQWQDDVSAVADVCEKNNDKFNRRRFWIACGGNQ